MAIDHKRSQYLRDNLKTRIQEQLLVFAPDMPEQYVIAWRGYLAATFEWGGLDYPEYKELLGMLPELHGLNPIGDLFLFDGTVSEPDRI